MTDRKDVARLPYRTFLARTLLTCGIGWVSSLGLLNGGLAAAQTADASDAIAPAPASPVVEAAPVKAAPAPAAAPRKLPPPIAAPERMAPAPAATPANKPAASKPISLPSPAQLQQATQAPRPSTAGNAANSGTTNSYIDATPQYNLGATKSYEPPAKIILSNRSNGCQTVLRRGQAIPGSLCNQGIPNNNQSGYGQMTIRNASPSARSSGVVHSTTAATGTRLPNPKQLATRFYNRTRRPLGRLGNGNTSLLFPLSVPAPITSLFGWRVHPISGQERFHSGTDLGAPTGTPVLAAYAGRIAIADFLGGYGLLVSIRHNDDTEETRYAHLSEIFVQPGEWVEQGDVIGRVGSTGYSTGPHLHFEFRERTGGGWVAQDPGLHLEYAMAQLVNSLRNGEVAAVPAGTLPAIPVPGVEGGAAAPNPADIQTGA